MFGTRVYELYARWEAAQETGSYFDLNDHGTPEEVSDVRHLIEELHANKSLADSSETPGPQVGDIFAGFRLLGVLGQGGFGTVFRAEDLRLGRKVALKVLHSRALDKPGAKAALIAEARALAVGHHDNVLPS